MTPMHVPRKVRRPPDPGGATGEATVVDLHAFREHPAWVLLGEPGAGKTDALLEESRATNGEFLSVGDFVVGEPPLELRGKTLFLDGLDEVRAGGGNDSTLRQVRAQLRRLGNPRFRISCRAADWYGSTDTEDLSGVVPEGRLEVLLLEPLSTEDILLILRENLKIPDPAAFLASAKSAGIDELLDNPQTLSMLVAATERGTTWPTSRDEIYRLACEQLSQEHRKRHRDRFRGRTQSKEELLDAAGQLDSVLLFSNLAGVARDKDSVNQRFVDLSDCDPPNPEAASVALESKLFRSHAEEQLYPAHRSVAEYLAARWLAKRVDTDGLPLGRVLNLLLGRDSQAIAGLRGVYAWLALHSRSARATLIESDPFTCAVYGDVKNFPNGDKRALITNLLSKARSTLFQRDFDTVQRLGALASVEFVPDLEQVLRSSDRSDIAQSKVVCAIDIVLHGEALPQLAPALLDLIRDDSRWPRLRYDALRAWLRSTEGPAGSLLLLEEVVQGRVSDPDDELAGILLDHLYPGNISGASLVQHLHKPKAPNLVGSYLLFWSYHLPAAIRPEDLPALLDGLVEKKELTHADPYETRLSAMADKLIAKGVTTYGDSVSDERLLSWLSIGANEYGMLRREEAERAAIAAWLEQRPDRYKRLLGRIYAQHEDETRSTSWVNRPAGLLHDAVAPADLARWHLDQARRSKRESVVREHVTEAIRLLARARDGAGISLDDIIEWGETPAIEADKNEPIQAVDRRQWLEKCLQCEISSVHTEFAQNKKKHKEEAKAGRTKRTADIAPLLAEVRSGTARPHVMHELAGVWMGRYSNIAGDTVEARFESYCENGSELLAAAKSGFISCLNRVDLPSVEEIIDLSIKSREHFVRLPCLVGMELLFEQGESKLEGLPEQTIRRLVAFHLTQGDGREPKWFAYLVTDFPAVVADVLVAYASATLAAGISFISGIYALQYDTRHRAVAERAAPRLLESFPTRVTADQLRHLAHLLKAMIQYSPSALGPLIKARLSKKKGMDTAQQVYWRAAAMLLDPEKHQASLWRYVGKSQARINHLSDLLSERYSDRKGAADLSAVSAGKLIELLTPHAEIEWPSDRGGEVTDAMRRGDQVRGLIAHLGSLASDDAAAQIERLLGNPAFAKLNWLLESAKHNLQQRRRENEFRFLPPRQVAEAFANKSPINVGDLAALALDHFDQIAVDIRKRNDDPYRHFWKETESNDAKFEAAGRDLVLTFFKERLTRFGIDCEPESDHAGNKRADITLSYHSSMRLPIEIKRHDNRDLWTALRDQLMKQYSTDSRADGYGIYIVFWYGGVGMPPATDGGRKPRSARELRERLEGLLEPRERQRVSVRVLDVTYPQ